MLYSVIAFWGTRVSSFSCCCGLSLVAALATRTITTSTTTTRTGSAGGVFGLVQKQRRQEQLKPQQRKVNERLSLKMSSTTASTTSTAASSSSPKIVAVAQLCSTTDKIQNLLDIATCAAWAKQQNAIMLFLPENCGFLGESAQQTANYADYMDDDDNAKTKNPDWLTRQLQRQVNIMSETISSNNTDHASNNNLESFSETGSNNNKMDHKNISILHGLQCICQASGLWISAGGVHFHNSKAASPATADQQQKEQQQDDEKKQQKTQQQQQRQQHMVTNTHLILDDQGQIRARYNKIHLFDVSLPNHEFKESNLTVAGNQLVTCGSPIGRLGLSICYDVRFPELYTSLVQPQSQQDHVQNGGGAQILLVPAAFTVPTGKAHWHILLRARAIENQCYVIAAAQYGQHNAVRCSYGHSLVIDPWGTVLADAGGFGKGDDEAQQQPQQRDNAKTNDSTTLIMPTPITTPSIITATIDLTNTLEPIRQRMPIAKHREAAKYRD